ncbi:UDP-glucose:glycoprotein glucosyltransferase 1 [Dermatophagoides farinae]|uniref:UDP-glucose:glycoprotein glucosyltransferase 1 n=1 Tax=Dermatophagoides farinae TaxID=6954 RepID=A0A922L815_DERFA|nr:UDP-glucose:glycoprotein glucosyltransferase 1-like [Dermatophagoides farinae]KAH7641055.1 udp-glucose:glycoprotein glucosyltransferase-like protein [Dermatophagoides farinae]KAH9526721.1 UDP-glucose:glycoprotein glucosyltransferase 1 [Dermatophagoides farinae]
MLNLSHRLSPSSLAFLFSLLLLLSKWSEQSTTHSSSSSSSSKSVKILLQSKWSQTPMYLEVAEFLAEENPDFYWQYLDDLQTESMALSSAAENWTTMQQQYQSSLRLASKLLRSEPKLSILKFALSLRSYSPRVIAFKNIIEDIFTSTNQLEKCNGSFIELTIPSVVDRPKYVCNNGDDISQAIDSMINHVQSDNVGQLSHPVVYSVDHIFPGRYSSIETSPHSITVILYATIGSKSFFRLHKLIKQQIDQGKPIRYIIRHNPQSTKMHVALSGYGVELAIKSTEYKAQDDTRVRGEVVESSNPIWKDDQEQSKPDEVAGFIFSKLKANNAALSDKLNEFRNHLMDQEKEIATLKVWELQEISLQAVTKVLSVQKEKALSVLRDISQNFPSVARSLVKIHVEPELKREIAWNQNHFYQNLNLATSDTALFINGLYHDIDSVDVFTLLDTMKNEYYTVSKLHTLLNGDHDRIKKLDASWERGQQQQQQLDFQMDIRDSSVLYINDIEKDRMYKSWPSSLQEMLRPTYPGILRNIRRNMYHLVLIIDPSRKESFDMLKMAESFYIHKAPVRIGLIFDVNDNQTITGYRNAGIACLEAYNYISQQKTPYEALSFVTDVIAYATSQGVRDLEPDDIVNHFKSKISKSEADDVFGADSSYDIGRKLSRDFLDRTGLEHGPKAMMNGVLLKESHLQADYFEEAVLSEIMRQSSQFQKAIYKAELTDEDDVLEWLMSKKTVMTRLNRVIFGLDHSNQKRMETSKYLDLTSGHQLPKQDDGSAYFMANINDLQATILSQLKYINSKKDCNPVTVWLASDFLTFDSRQILRAGLNHLRENSRYMRLSLIYVNHNPVTRVLESALSTISSPSQLLSFLNKVAVMDYQDWDANIEQIGQLISDEYRKAFYERHSLLKANPNSSPFPLHQAIASRLFGISSSDNFALILNGKIFKVPVLLSSSSSSSTDHDHGGHKLAFNEDDFTLMERYAQNFWSEKILNTLNNDERNAGTRKCSDLVLRICSVLLSKSSSTNSASYKQRYEINNVHDEHSVLVLEPRHPSQPFIELTAILDPLTRGAQKISPILATFYEVFNARVKIHFNAVEKHSDMPLKSFYRFVLDQEPRFVSASGSIINPVALFKSMPKTPLFTVGMSVPENWMVEAVEAIYDLDNIHLAQVDSNIVGAVFELEHLLVEGHCFEQSSGSPPRGLQFTLGTQTKPTMYDTIVMANLGYFQLKASPGIWMLRLRQGRSTDIYTIVSHDNTDQVANTTKVIPIVSSFRSLVIKIRVNKKPGKQNEELLYDSDDNSLDDQSGGGWFSGWNSEKSTRQYSADKGAKDSSGEDEDSKRINIFSLASGHLYERLLRIMMMSVLKNTKTPVKFWFLKNYLSPQFKQVLPHMARQYEFEYELVQYKWPRWLHQQTEKQRIIWGYKILFLDVLFPLDVKKIIFVDADQVVRADLRELRDLDLEGAPYGYTPFCDSRKDMDGFRFWKSGYWATHLHGRKYHISALYVVDLQKFRRIAAGDRLRGQYQGLSQDPNSLSNLDQDLPNNMIHQVAIKSLPQEWLWCETWCDDDSKQQAKTIDLCNNPKTKEPKLTSARRIVAEWENYDRELKEFLERLRQNFKQNDDKMKYPSDGKSSHSHQEL